MDHFFDEQQPQAVFKHGLLGRYASYFAGPAGAGGDGRILYVDGYAGPGRYDDGSAGSPLVLLAAGEGSTEFGRKPEYVFVEADRAMARALASELTKSGATARIINDSFENTWRDLLAERPLSSTLLFLDPFSLSLDSNAIAEILRMSSSSHKIDVLYHFSVASVARMASLVVQQAASDSAIRKVGDRIDSLLGTAEWRKEFIDQEEPSYAIAATLAQRFGEDIAKRTGTSSASVDVRRRPGHLPIYSLVLLTRYKPARWEFCSMAGLAHVDWILRCDQDEFDAHLAELDLTGQVPLFTDAAPSRRSIEDRIAEQATAYLVGHLPELLARRGPLLPIDDPVAFYGDFFGRARETHLRAAIKTLHAQGIVEDNGVGKFFRRPIALVG